MQTVELIRPYKTSLTLQTSELLSWDECIQFASFYEEGKRVAKNGLLSEFAPATPFNEACKNESQSAFMRSTGISPEKMRLFWEVCSIDSQALYLKGDISNDELIENIYEGARKSQVDPEAFYKLVQALYLVSIKEKEVSVRVTGIFSRVVAFASSIIGYFKEPVLRLERQQRERVAQVTDILVYAKQGERVFQDLLKDVACKKDLNDFQKALTDSRRSLACYIEKVHQEMLASGSDQERYKALKRGFRDIFAYDQNGGKRYNQELERAVKTFRTDYLCRYSMSKVLNCIREQQCLNTEEEQELLRLIPHTFLHGSNGAVLANLPATSMHLVPSGRLARAGIIPFSGELREGSQFNAINAYRLSGTSFINGDRAIDYANKNFYTDKENEDALVTEFIETYTNRESPIFRHGFNEDGADWMRTSIAILRLRSLFPERYEKHKESLRGLITRMQKDWNGFKKTRYYWECMPSKSLNVVSRLFRRYFAIDRGDYLPFFKRAEAALERLKSVITCDISPASFSAIPKPFPIVFASKTIHARANQHARYENNPHKSVLLGRDIQTVFVKDADREEMKCYLEKHGLENAVVIERLEALQKAIELSNFAENYFSCIASKKQSKPIN